GCRVVVPWIAGQALRYEGLPVHRENLLGLLVGDIAPARLVLADVDRLAIADAGVTGSVDRGRGDGMHHVGNILAELAERVLDADAFGVFRQDEGAVPHHYVGLGSVQKLDLRFPLYLVGEP